MVVLPFLDRIISTIAIFDIIQYFIFSQLLPYTAEDMLSRSYRVSDKSVLSGSKKVHLYGINYVTGKVRIILLLCFLFVSRSLHCKNHNCSTRISMGLLHLVLIFICKIIIHYKRLLVRQSFEIVTCKILCEDIKEPHQQ